MSPSTAFLNIAGYFKYNLLQVVSCKFLVSSHSLDFVPVTFVNY
jgi:hypothetical protein